MYKPPLLALLLAVILIITACAPRDQEPRLVVLISIDGLRSDLLDRYDSAFTGGFRRLRDTGYRFDNAWVDHAITVSHAGHVTIATGMQPAHHGIVDAAFYVPAANGRMLVDAVEDDAEAIPGSPDDIGVSPRKVLRSGLSEWVLDADSDARSLAVGSGNVSSLLYTFHTPADVYWYREGRYVTSTFYRNDYPEWIQEFNAIDLPLYKDRSITWSTRVPESLRHLARADEAPFEGDHVHTTFPHQFEAELADAIAQDAESALNMWLRWTPALDLATLALAQRGVSNLALGQRDSTDSLSIVLSMVDSNNHYYGPLSLETFDTLLQIDAALGAFFTFLDATVGENRYVVALSSDHGFPEVPEFRAANGRPGRRLDANTIDSLLKDVGAVVSGTPVSIASRVAEIAEGRDFVAEAFTPEALSVAATSTTSESPDHFLRLYQNSYRPDRVPRLPLFSLGNGESSIAEAGVMIRLEEGTMIDIDAATHGSPYDYDRRVPLIFMGAGVKRGVSHLVVRTVDIAPTLADLGKVKAPPDLDGRVLKLD